MRALAAVIPAAALAVITFPALATTLHVCPDGSGDYSTIQAAVDAASSGDTIDLCAGTFQGPGNFDLVFGAKDLVLRSDYGYEAAIIDATVLVGDEQGPEPHFGIILSPGTTTRIEGITIQGALKWDAQGVRGDGAALSAIDASITLERVRILGHSHYSSAAMRGAGVFLSSGTLVAYDCVFERNKAKDAGGAIFAENSWITVQQCTFIGNGSCIRSSAVRFDGGSISDCIFERGSGGNCEAPPNGNPLLITGGKVTVERCRFTNNVDIHGGCARIGGGAEVVFDDCLIEGAIGESGGAMEVGGGDVTVRNSTFRNNYAFWTGGAISGHGGTLTLEHCIFLNNDSGRLWLGAIAMYAGELQVRGCTFYGNALRGGATIWLGDGASLSLENAIIAFGGRAGSPYGAVHCAGTAAYLSARCTDIYANGGGDWVGCIAGMEKVNENLSADPLFCDAASDNLALHSASPCAPAHSGTCGLIGALGVACGPTAIQSSTWGSIKALYR